MSLGGNCREPRAGSRGALCSRPPGSVPPPAASKLTFSGHQSGPMEGRAWAPGLGAFFFREVLGRQSSWLATLHSVVLASCGLGNSASRVGLSHGPAAWGRLAQRSPGCSPRQWGLLGPAPLFPGAGGAGGKGALSGKDPASAPCEHLGAWLQTVSDSVHSFLSLAWAPAGGLAGSAEGWPLSRTPRQLIYSRAAICRSPSAFSGAVKETQATSV